MCSRHVTPVVTLTMWLLAATACKDDELDASGEENEGALGETCDPTADPNDDDAEGRCADGLACEPTDDGSVCAAPIELHGQVIDALDGGPIEGAVIAALDETGAPVGDAARSDAMGEYVLRVSARRDAAGALASAVRWTLFAGAEDYAIFPGGLRSPLPVDATAPMEATDDEEHVYSIIENATTTVALLPLAAEDAGGVTVTGRVDAVAPGGTLVVAEGGAVPAPYTIADATGAFVLFNVPAEAAAIRGYRTGIYLSPTTVS
ncbi:MAG: hypothetical protein JNK45_03365, partial [Myxococcales bacterium]|nr:hypothetical protein [Myxococcales bacterium]